MLPAIVFCCAAQAFARAGGGESFGGSSGGGDMGGGGGDGLGIILYFLIRLVFAQPLIGIPLLIVFIVIVARMGRSARTGAQYRTIAQATQRAAIARQAVVPGVVDSVRQRDPAFDEAGFLKRVRQAFVEIQTAWSAQDLSRVRRFISDGIRERFEIQIGMQKAEGFRNQLENLVVTSAGIVGATSDTHFDSVTVEITAHGRDTDVDLKTGKVLRTKTSEPFTELWSFLRRPGARTLGKPGLFEGFCPNCGASLELSDAGRCENCDSVVTSGDYDWVLAEITQGSVWSAGTDPAVVPGYREMAARDAAFNLQHVEDRTSVIFWRYVMCNFEGRADALRKVASPSFTSEFGQTLKLAREGDWWLFFRDAAVGGVDVQRIVRSPDGGSDRIEVLVRWSARNAQRNAAGQTRNAGDRSIRPSVFVLERNSSASTPAGTAFLSSHCQGCGAPYEGGDSGSCGYCGRPLNDGSQDWVLSSIERFDPSTVRADAVDTMARASLVPPEVLIASMASAMFSDGQVDEREERLLRGFASSRSVPAERIDELLSAIRAGGSTLPAAPDREAAPEVLGAMARMALADGKLSGEETELLGRFAESAGLARADVSMVIAKQRSLLYAEAKARRS
jgi:uncharacterized tellurite resistance protein B-like protein